MVLEVGCKDSHLGLCSSQKQFNLVDFPYDEVFDSWVEWNSDGMKLRVLYVCKLVQFGCTSMF